MHKVAELYGKALELEPEVPFTVLTPASVPPATYLSAMITNEVEDAWEAVVFRINEDELRMEAWTGATLLASCPMSAWKTGSPTSPTQHALQKYKHTCVGGTFDHLHAGHKLMLTASALITTERLTVGLSGTLTPLFLSLPSRERGL
jgi:hypothetical protein